jgi:hypothetical protein
MCPAFNVPSPAFSSHSRAGEDRLSGVLRGDGVVAAEEVDLASAAVDVTDEGAGRALGRRSIGHR